MTRRKGRWTAKEVQALEKYVGANADRLVSNFYKNILVGYLRFPKPYGFFSGLSKILKRKLSQCKAKFYEMEAELYTEVLLVFPLHFCLFLNIRRQKKEKALNAARTPDFEEIDILSKKGESGSVDRGCGESQKNRRSEHSSPEQLERAVFHRMSPEGVTQGRLKVMQLFLDQKLKLTIPNKGAFGAGLILAEREYITRLVRKTLEESSHNSLANQRRQGKTLIKFRSEENQKQNRKGKLQYKKNKS